MPDPALSPTPSSSASSAPALDTAAAPTAAPATPTDILRRLGPASVLAVVALAMPPLGGVLLLVYINSIALWLAGHQGLGIVLYATAFALLAGLALLPTYAQAILGGWAFGFAFGFPAALAGFVGGAVLGYIIALRASGDRVVRLIDEKPKWAAVRDALLPADAPSSSSSAGFWKTLGLVALLRVPPNSPFAMTNLVMASVKVPWTPYVLGTLLGMAPRTAAAVWIAADLRAHFASIKDGLDAPKPWWLLAAGIGGVIVVLAVIGALAGRAWRRVTQGREPRPAA